MNILNIILAKTTTGAAIEIVILLLVAGLIGYLSAHFYNKSVYTKKIKVLEDEKSGLERRITGLERDIEELKKKAEEARKK